MGPSHYCCSSCSEYDVSYITLLSLPVDEIQPILHVVNRDPNLFSRARVYPYTCECTCVRARAKKGSATNQPQPTSRPSGPASNQTIARKSWGAGPRPYIGQSSGQVGRPLAGPLFTKIWGVKMIVGREPRYDTVFIHFTFLLLLPFYKWPCYWSYSFWPSLCLY